MKKTIFIIGLLIATPAIAQQQQQSPSEVALQINTIIGQWAQALIQQAKTIDELQKQLKEEQLKNKGLEDKVNGTKPGTPTKP